MRQRKKKKIKKIVKVSHIIMQTQAYTPFSVRSSQAQRNISECWNIADRLLDPN